MIERRWLHDDPYPAVRQWRPARWQRMFARLLGWTICLLCLVAPLSWPASAQQGITPCAAFSVSVSGTSANQQLSSCGTTILLWNVGTQELFYNVGAASTTAATTSNFSIPGASFVVLNLNNTRPYLAAITASSTTTLRITQGQAR